MDFNFTGTIGSIIDFVLVFTTIIIVSFGVFNIWSWFIFQILISNAFKWLGIYKLFIQFIFTKEKIKYIDQDRDTFIDFCSISVEPFLQDGQQIQLIGLLRSGHITSVLCQRMDGITKWNICNASYIVFNDLDITHWAEMPDISNLKK